MKTVTILLVAFVGCVTAGRCADPVFHPAGNASYLEQLRQVKENAEKQTEELNRQTEACKIETMRLECITALMKKADALRVASVKKRDPDATVLRMAGEKIFEVADELSALWFPGKYPSTEKTHAINGKQVVRPDNRPGH